MANDITYVFIFLCRAVEMCAAYSTADSSRAFRKSVLGRLKVLNFDFGLNKKIRDRLFVEIISDLVYV